MLKKPLEHGFVGGVLVKDDRSLPSRTDGDSAGEGGKVSSSMGFIRFSKSAQRSTGLYFSSCNLVNEVPSAVIWRSCQNCNHAPSGVQNRYASPATFVLDDESGVGCRRSLTCHPTLLTSTCVLNALQQPHGVEKRAVPLHRPSLRIHWRQHQRHSHRRPLLWGPRRGCAFYEPQAGWGLDLGKPSQPVEPCVFLHGSSRSWNAACFAMTSVGRGSRWRSL